MSSRSPRFLVASSLLGVSGATAAFAHPVLARHGPGEGFAAAGSLLVLLGTLVLAFGIVIMVLVRTLKKR